MIWMWMVVFLNHHMRAWESNQPSPILLLAHHTLQFYHLIKYMHRISQQFLHPNYLQRESEQKNNAGNAIGQNVMMIKQKDTAKSDVMTAIEYIVTAREG